MNFVVESSKKLPEVKIITTKNFADSRGLFKETFSSRDIGENSTWVQDNESCSKQYVIRGLHYQLKHPQAKMVRCSNGKILDVAADIRIGSPTFGLYHIEILSSMNGKMLYVPRGFAHGFAALEESTVCYKCDEYYCPGDDFGIIWDDRILNIDWTFDDPKMSPKDFKHPTLKQAMEMGILPIYEGNNNA